MQELKRIATLFEAPSLFELGLIACLLILSIVALQVI